MGQEVPILCQNICLYFIYKNF